MKIADYADKAIFVMTSALMLEAETAVNSK